MTQYVQLDILKENTMARVVATGGGHDGITVAKGFDPIVEVILIKQRDQFVYHTAAPCVVVDEVWKQTIFMLYTNPLTRGCFVHGIILRVESTIVHVYGYDPTETDYLVFTTGSTYPFPAKYSLSNSAVARARLTRLYENFKGARSVMLVGGGTVGVELAGELVHTFPGIEITIVEKEDTILSSPGYSEELREEVSTQLAELDIRVITESELAFLPPHSVGEFGYFQVSALGGGQIEGGIWLQRYGITAGMGYLHGTGYEELPHPSDILRVKRSLQAVGHERSYAIDGLTDMRESKRADVAYQQARVVIASLSALIAGEPPEAVYEPMGKWVILSFGSNMGASQLVDAEGVSCIASADQTMEAKGADPMVVPYVRL